MKKRETAYTFDASEKTVTLSNYTTVDLEGLLLITNVTDQIIIYNFADTTLGATAATNVFTLEYVTTGMSDTDDLLIMYDDGKTINKSVSSVTDWTSVAQNTVAESAEIDCSGNVSTLLCIQAFLDTETAHTGTRFIVQVSSNTSGDEDWHDYAEFVGLIGTANKEDITNNPAATGTTVFTVASTTGYTTLGRWIAVEDATLVNSELMFQTAYSNNTSVTVLDGSTIEHANTADLYNIAISQVMVLDKTVYRCRLIVDNTYDTDGSTLNYKLRISKVTAL